MKSFVLTMLITVSVATLAAVAIARVIFPETAGSPATARTAAASDGEYTPQQALDTVTARFGNSPAAERRKQGFRDRATITPNSQPRHWNVQYEGAIWVAHGTGDDGPYASPENEAARRFEVEAGGP
jgi:hypothetical protein